MPIKKWVGSCDLAFYTGTGGYHRHGDLVDVPDDVLERDPSRWEDAPAKSKANKNDDPDPEG